MTRSVRHTPKVGIAGASAGPYRQLRAGQERARARALMAAERWDEAGAVLARWDEWACDRDGKQWLGGAHGHLLRK